MSKAKERPNFTISYRTTPEVDYEEFKEDFLNCFMKIDEIKEKYGLTKSEFKEYRQRVLDETGLKRKPTYTYSSIHFFGGAEYIQKKSNGYIVVKTFNNSRDGYSTKYFGRYPDYETAKMVRDKLIESNWDERLGTYLKEEYGLSRSDIRPAYDRAKKIYSEFKDLYFNSSLQIKEIQVQLGISQRVYKYLIDMIRDEIGDMNYRRVPRT